ncbi:MAG: beta-lactamase family protein [Candidatus Eremiobacteraeota bacterium]|nr:beta-lactamase family protein [Candidatus Eremiobacteraeota bacterium]
MPTATPHVALNTAAIDAIVQQTYAGSWGVELGIYENGVPLYEQGYGLRDRGLPDTFVSRPNFWGLPQPDKTFAFARGAFAPDANTVFNMASVSKEFTAAAILLLQQDGKVSLNDTVSKYFPTFPRGNEITLLDAMQHRSGLVDYVDRFVTQAPEFAPAYQTFMASGQTDLSATVTQLATYPLNFAPGTQFEYSNSNYLLLSLIVAQVSGESLGAFLQQRIFGPLGMTQTHVGDYGPQPGGDIALGYRDEGSGPVRTWQWNLQWLAGPGGLTSTVRDMEKWDRAVRAPGIFTQATLTQMFAPSPIAAPYGAYAAGWVISTLNGHPYVWHDGAIGGFQTMNALFPDLGIDIVILTNDGTGKDPYYIIPQILGLVTN